MTEPYEPFENRESGDGDRDAGGRFKPGCKGGPGSPAARHARQLRERLNEALHKICSPDRLLNVLDALMKLAEAGDVQAIKLVCELIRGPYRDVVLNERVDEIEDVVRSRQEPSNV